MLRDTSVFIYVPDLYNDNKSLKEALLCHSLSVGQKFKVLSVAIISQAIK